MKILKSTKLLLLLAAMLTLPAAAEASSLRKRLLDFGIAVGATLFAESISEKKQNVSCSSNQALSFNNTTLYSISNQAYPSMRLTFECLKNTQNSPLNNVKIQLWATNSPYRGNNLNGYFLTEYQFNNSLNPQYYFPNFDQRFNLNQSTVNSLKNSNGVYNIVIVAIGKKSGDSKEYIWGWSNHSKYNFLTNQWQS